MFNLTKTDETTAIQRMNYMRGLFALLIVLGHCSMHFEKEILPLLIIHKFNMVSVCFFFIISGWSLTYNFYNKKNYLGSFLKNKVLKLIIFAVVCQIVGKLSNWLVLHKPVSVGVELITGWNWYIYEIVAYYIAFFFIYRFLKKKNMRVIVLLLVSIAVSVFTWYMSNNDDTFWKHAYHFSSLCFVWGVIFCEFYEGFVKCLNRKIICSAILLLVGGLSCICVKMPQGSFFGGVILHNVVGICIMSLVAVWAHFIDYTKIPIVGWLTKYSTEIYLYQFATLTVFDELFKINNQNIDLLYVCSVVVVTLIQAVIMHHVNKLISKII